MKVIQETCREH